MTETPATPVDELNPHAPVATEAVTREDLEEAPAIPNPVPGPDVKKPNKVDEKRFRIFQQRMQRYMKAHPKATAKEAQEALQKEDYDSLSTEEKLRKTQQFFGVAMGSLENRINEALRKMMGNLVDMDSSMQVNFGAVAKSLIKLGCTREEQQAFINEMEVELKEAAAAEAAAAAKEEAEMQARVAEQKAKMEEAKKVNLDSRESAEAALKNVESTKLNPTESTPSLPPEARVF